MKVELFSTDCVKCKRLEFSLHQALSEAKIDAELIKISDIKEMERRGLMTVPALAIDGKIIFAGIVPPVSELRTHADRKEPLERVFITAFPRISTHMIVGSIHPIWGDSWWSPRPIFPQAGTSGSSPLTPTIEEVLIP